MIGGRLGTLPHIVVSRGHVDVSETYGTQSVARRSSRHGPDDPPPQPAQSNPEEGDGARVGGADVGVDVRKHLEAGL